MPVTLCFIKDKHKVMEHKIPLETYFAGLLQKVEWQIQEYEDTAADTLTLCRLCVDYLQEILGELKNFIISYPFASTEEEIHFFKELKPLLASKIIYYNTVYKIEVRFPSGSAKGLPAVGNRPDFKVVPAELGVLPVPPNESHLLGQAVFHAWEA